MDLTLVSSRGYCFNVVVTSSCYHSSFLLHLQEFPPYPPALLANVSPLNEQGLDLLSQHLVCFPDGRISADRSMKHDYFAGIDPSLK